MQKVKVTDKLASTILFRSFKRRRTQIEERLAFNRERNERTSERDREWEWAARINRPWNINCDNENKKPKQPIANWEEEEKQNTHPLWYRSERRDETHQQN